MEQTRVERSGGGGGEGKEEKGRERRVTGSWEESALRLSGSARGISTWPWTSAALLIYDTRQAPKLFQFFAFIEQDPTAAKLSSTCEGS